jgi:flagellar basal-body rod protein FlgF
MQNAINITLAKQLALNRQMEVLANNLGNISTAGYQNESVVFNDMLFKPNTKNELAFVSDVGMNRDLTNGKLQTTGRPYDLAIKGEGYFKVHTDNGKMYTRDGGFSLDHEGMLVTSNGNYVLDASDTPISIPSTAKKVEVNKDGSVIIDGNVSQMVGVVSFDDVRQLERVGNNLLKTDQPEFEVGDFSMVQGSIEGSNVQPIFEITKMIDTERSFTMAAKLIDSMDEMVRNTIKKLAK